jgi:hypothetical protein
MIVGRKSDFWDWKEERSTGERENWVGGKNNKQRKVVVGVFIIIKKKIIKKN